MGSPACQLVKLLKCSCIRMTVYFTKEETGVPSKTLSPSRNLFSHCGVGGGVIKPKQLVYFNLKIILIRILCAHGLKSQHAARTVEADAITSTGGQGEGGRPVRLTFSSCSLATGWSQPAALTGILGPAGSPGKIGPFPVWSVLSCTDFWLE